MTFLYFYNFMKELFLSHSIYRQIQNLLISLKKEAYPQCFFTKRFDLGIVPICTYFTAYLQISKQFYFPKQFNEFWICSMALNFYFRRPRFLKMFQDVVQNMHSFIFNFVVYIQVMLREYVILLTYEIYTMHYTK